MSFTRTARCMAYGVQVEAGDRPPHHRSLRTSLERVVEAGAKRTRTCATVIPFSAPAVTSRRVAVVRPCSSLSSGTDNWDYLPRGVEANVFVVVGKSFG